MSMLIIGVNPPKSCYACSWYNKVKCPVDDGRYYYRVQRHPSCPLIELPPHGRLIDADKLKSRLVLDNDSNELQRISADILKWIDIQETVIEGSET